MDPISRTLEAGVDKSTSQREHINEMMLIHHGLATAAQCVEFRQRRERDQAGKPGGPQPGPPPPLLPRLNLFGNLQHVYFPTEPPDDWTRYSYTPGQLLYEYQHRQFSPGNTTGGSGRAVGDLYNQIDVVPNTKGKDVLLHSYAAFFIRFKAFDTDGALGLATLRLPNVDIRIRKRAYTLLPGSTVRQFVRDGQGVETALWANWQALLYARFFTLAPLALPGAAPEFLPPERVETFGRSGAAVALHQQGLLATNQANVTQQSRWFDFGRRGDLYFMCQSGTEYLIELGLGTSVHITDSAPLRVEHGLFFDSSTRIPVVHVDTLKYR